MVSLPLAQADRIGPTDSLGTFTQEEQARRLGLRVVGTSGSFNSVLSTKTRREQDGLNLSLNLPSVKGEKRGQKKLKFLVQFGPCLVGFLLSF